jgi:hypothetical protein
MTDSLETSRDIVIYNLIHLPMCHIIRFALFLAFFRHSYFKASLHPEIEAAKMHYLPTPLPRDHQQRQPEYARLYRHDLRVHYSV